jgi:hypothetical protein
MPRRARAPLLAVITTTVTFALAACGDPAGPAPATGGDSASALRMGTYGAGVNGQTNGSNDRAAAQGGDGNEGSQPVDQRRPRAEGGKAGASTNPVEDGAARVGAQGGKIGASTNPVGDATGVGVQGSKPGIISGECPCPTAQGSKSSTPSGTV